LLGLAAGLLAPSSGKVIWDGEPVRLGPNQHIGMAFQQPGLFPWLTVLQNVAIGLRTRGHSRREARRIAEEFLATVGLADSQDAYPSQLSGGMAQRVGIARALALRPRLLLLDEPFAAVDAEAIALGNMIVVMSQRPATVQRIIPVNPRRAQSHERGVRSQACGDARMSRRDDGHHCPVKKTVLAGARFPRSSSVRCSP
jgi:ABC-type nitrate/sulfonate/bicarbonate transport system ATPase subunit